HDEVFNSWGGTTAAASGNRKQEISSSIRYFACCSALQSPWEPRATSRRAVRAPPVRGGPTPDHHRTFARRGRGSLIDLSAVATQLFVLNCRKDNPIGKRAGAA